MKYLRLTGRPDPERAPAAFTVLADSPYVDEARLLEWNPTDSRGLTGFFEVEGNREAVEGALGALAEVVSVETAPAGENAFYQLVTLDGERHAIIQRVFDWVTSDGLIVRKPIVYRDGAVHAQFVGSAGAIQQVVDGLPAFVDIAVHEIGGGGFAPGNLLEALSSRQREAIVAATAAGYYDDPKQATHEDIAAALGCAPSTASEHLRKAESKLVCRVLREERPDLFASDAAGQAPRSVSTTDDP